VFLAEIFIFGPTFLDKKKTFLQFFDSPKFGEGAGAVIVSTPATSPLLKDRVSLL